MAKTKPVSKSKNAKKEVKKPAKKPVPVAKKPTVINRGKVQPVKVEQKAVKDVKKAVVDKTKKASEVKPTAVHNAKAQSAVAVKNQTKPTKADSKTKSKSKKVEKKEEDFDDELIADDFGESEIAEYEEDLKAVEEDDEDLNDLDLDDSDTDVKDEEVYLTDSEGRRLCKVRDCDQVANVEAYCRYHYLLLWKKIQTRKHILQDNKLEKYISDLMARYPDKFVDLVKKDLKTEKDFLAIIQELEIDESAMIDADNDDEVQSFSDEIRGIGDAPSMDDDGDY